MDQGSKSFSSLAGLLLALMVCSAAHADDIRIAVVGAREVDPVPVDLLTTSLADVSGIVVLERAEILRVLNEQSLGAGREADWVALGQLLGADGLVLLEPLTHDGRNMLLGRLVAVRPGVVLNSIVTPWPIADPLEWVQLTSRSFRASFGKLKVSRQQAVPLSIVNFRAAIDSPAQREIESILKTRLAHRLARETELFVLERSNLSMLGFERLLGGIDEAPFWSGSYLLEGIVNRERISKSTVTLDLVLTPPSGGRVVSLHVEGPADDLPALVADAVAQILEALDRKAAGISWDPMEEAVNYLEEAKWASRWKAHGQAASAAENAWQLGLRNHAAAHSWVNNLAHTLSAEKRTFFDIVADRGYVLDSPAPGVLDRAVTMLDVYESFTRMNPSLNPRQRAAWNDLGLGTLSRASEVLRHHHFLSKRKPATDAKLAELRLRLRRTADLIPAEYERSGEEWEGMKGLGIPRSAGHVRLLFGALWQDSPASAIDMYRAMIESGAFMRHMSEVIKRDWRHPWLPRWRPEDDAASVRSRRNQFVETLKFDGKPEFQAAGLLLALHQSELQPEISEAADAVYDFVHAASRAEGRGLTPAFIRAFDGLIDLKRETTYDGKTPELVTRHEQEMGYLRIKVGLQHTDSLDSYVTAARFNYTEEQAREIMVLIEGLRDTFANPWGIDIQTRGLRELAGLPPKPASSSGGFSEVSKEFVAHLESLLGDLEIDRSFDDRMGQIHMVSFTPEQAESLLPLLRRYRNEFGMRGWIPTLEHQLARTVSFSASTYAIRRSTEDIIADMAAARQAQPLQVFQAAAQSGNSLEHDPVTSFAEAFEGRPIGPKVVAGAKLAGMAFLVAVAILLFLSKRSDKTHRKKAGK